MTTRKMFSFLNFNFLLRMFYIVSKISGFGFVSIDFKSAKLKTQWKKVNCAIFIISISLSFYANFHPAYFPVNQVVPSQLLEIGVNLITRGLLVVLCATKITLFVERRKFFFIVSNIIKFNKMVK